MDQATNNELISLKAEVYDLSKSNQSYQSLLVSIAEALDIDFRKGINTEELLNKIKELKTK